MRFKQWNIPDSENTYHIHTYEYIKCSSRTHHLIWWAPQTPKLYKVQKILWGAKKWKVKYFQEDSLSCRLQANNYSVVTTNRQCLCQTLFLNSQPSSTFSEEVVRVNKTLVPNILHCGRWEVLIEVKWYPGHYAVVFRRNDFTLASEDQSIKAFSFHLFHQKHIIKICKKSYGEN